jgi:hypothetical protein
MVRRVNHTHVILRPKAEESPTQFLAEFTLEARRFFASLRMTRAERFRMAIFIAIFTILLSPSLFAEEEDYWLSETPAADEGGQFAQGVAGGSAAPADEAAGGSLADVMGTGEAAGDPSKSLVLKLMVVNPSTKHKQTFPLKAYLPEEVKVEHILSKGDLEIAYDSVKQSYFLQKEIELEPGESVVKEVKVQDVWFITEEKLNSLSEEAHDIFEKLQATAYGEQGRLLMNNIEVLLMQILERQQDKTLTPNEHISVYRDNKKKIYDIEMDLMAMRRFLSAAGEGLIGSTQSKTGTMPSFFSKIAEASKNGMVPTWILWRVIFIILIFLGLVSFLFVMVFQHQLRLSFSRKKLSEAIKAIANKDKEKDKTKDKQKKMEMRISEFYPGLNDGAKRMKADDAA